MPYPALSGMTDEDATALVAFLRSLEPVAQENLPHEVSLPFSGLAMRVWRWLFLSRSKPGLPLGQTPLPEAATSANTSPIVRNAIPRARCLARLTGRATWPGSGRY